MRSKKQVLEKIYKKLEKLSIKGNSNLYVYQEYINELIEKGQYSNFKDCLNYYYKINIRTMDVQEVKRKTWDLILFTTNTDTQRKLSSLYEQFNVSQQGYEIFDNSTNQKLGEIKEIENIDYTNKYEYSDPNYLDNEFATKTNIKRTFLEVNKNNTILIVNNIDETIDEYKNLIQRYKIGLEFLKQ